MTDQAGRGLSSVTKAADRERKARADLDLAVFRAIRAGATPDQVREALGESPIEFTKRFSPLVRGETDPARTQS